MKKFGILFALIAVLALGTTAFAANTVYLWNMADPGATDKSGPAAESDVALVYIPDNATANEATLGVPNRISGGAKTVTTPEPNYGTPSLRFAMGTGKTLNLAEVVSPDATSRDIRIGEINSPDLTVTGRGTVVFNARLVGGTAASFDVTNGTARFNAANVVAATGSLRVRAISNTASPVVEITAGNAINIGAAAVSLDVSVAPAKMIVKGTGTFNAAPGIAWFMYDAASARSSQLEIVEGGSVTVGTARQAADFGGFMRGSVLVDGASKLEVVVSGDGAAAGRVNAPFTNTVAIVTSGEVLFSGRTGTNAGVAPSSANYAFQNATATGVNPAYVGRLTIVGGTVTTAAAVSGVGAGAIGDAVVTVNGGTLTLNGADSITRTARAGTGSLTVNDGGSVVLGVGAALSNNGGVVPDFAVNKGGQVTFSAAGALAVPVTISDAKMTVTNRTFDSVTAPATGNITFGGGLDLTVGAAGWAPTSRNFDTPNVTATIRFTWAANSTTDEPRVGFIDALTRDVAAGSVPPVLAPIVKIVMPAYNTATAAAANKEVLLFQSRVYPGTAEGNVVAAGRFSLDGDTKGSWTLFNNPNKTELWAKSTGDAPLTLVPTLDKSGAEINVDGKDTVKVTWNADDVTVALASDNPKVTVALLNGSTDTYEVKVAADATVGTVAKITFTGTKIGYNNGVGTFTVTVKVPVTEKVDQSKIVAAGATIDPVTGVITFPAK